MDSRISIVDEQLLEQETMSLLQVLESIVFNRAFAAVFSNSAVVASWSEFGDADDVGCCCCQCHPTFAIWHLMKRKFSRMVTVAVAVGIVRKIKKLFVGCTRIKLCCKNLNR